MPLDGPTAALEVQEKDLQKQDRGQEDVMMGYGWGMGTGGWIAMTVFWVALLVLVIWGVTRLLPGAGRGGESGAPRTETPEEILDRRFALGEIDDETYSRMRTELTSARAGRR